MHQQLGEAVGAFDGAYRQFTEAVRKDAALTEALLEGRDGWADLLTYKLVPHLAGEGCLIVAVAGGTNTGKSTVFNVLLGEALSPVRATAAATRRPLVAGSRGRAEQCLAGKLVPEFTPRRFDTPEALVSGETPVDALFVAVAETLPDTLVLLDTPDVDSIERENWAVAEHIRAAGDVVVAVLTAEKYRDERVVSFFRSARDAGRLVLPVMNKANPANSFAVAHQQLQEFCNDLGYDGVCFVAPHDFALAEDPLAAEVRSVDGAATLREHLHTLDIPSLKASVLRDTVRRFALDARGFVDHAEEVAHRLESAAASFEASAATEAKRYDPVPGAEVGGLFHEYVQSRRGAFRRSIGTASRQVVRGVTAVSRTVRHALTSRTQLESAQPAASEAEIRALHRQQVERIARDLVAHYHEAAGGLREPAATLVREGLDNLDAQAAVDAVVRETLRAESVSEEFRAHARRMLDAWWTGHRGQRRVVEALDGLLAVTPAAIAVPIALYTGPGLPEASLAVAGPIVEQFAARVFEYQFGDAMFDFLSPWKREQQEALEAALRRHITRPVLERLRAGEAVFNAGPLATMQDALDTCAEA